MKQWLVRRGLLATLPIIGLGALALHACSSESGGPTASSPSSAVGDAQQTSQEHEIAPSQRARENLTRVAQFKRFVMPPKVQAAPSPAGVKPPALAKTKLEPEVNAVVAKGDAERFVAQGERIRAQVSEALKGQVMRPATVDLPKTAGGFVRIQPDASTIGIEFTAKGVKANVPFETADGLVNYPGAAPGGGDMVLRVSSDAVEDYIVLNEKPERPFVDYLVDVSEVGGLRLYDNTLEFLSKSGDPQIRVRPPLVFDTDGTSHPALVSLPDCAADASPLAPWDRPVTAPGAAQCTVRVSWNDAKVVYPAIIDPVWTTAGSLATARYRNASVKQTLNGFTLTCGGIDNNGDALASCEQYNPGTNTWATAPAMKKARSQFTLIAVGNDTLAVGDSSSYTSELLSGGVWTATVTDFSAGINYLSLQGLMPALTSDGLWVVLLDYNGKPYRYSVAGKAWSVGTSSGVYRSSWETILQPGTGAVMRCGGTSNVNAALKTCEKYTPATDTWVMPGAAGAIADMNAARSYAAWASIDATSVMLYGGYNPVTQTYIQSAEIYSTTNNAWTSIGSIPNSIYEYNQHNTSALHSGANRILSIASGMMVYNIAAKTWTQLSNYDEQGNYFYASQDYTVASAGAKVIIVPVTPPNGQSGAQTACKLFDVGAKGAQCNSVAECDTNLYCVKNSQYDIGYCCDTACSDPCQSCRADHKQSGLANGTCGPKNTSLYIGYEHPTACPSDGTTCGTVGGYCDGAGGCLKQSNTTYCGNQSCADEDTQNNTRYCDGKGACAAQTTTNCATGFGCVQSSCADYCYSDAQCTSSYYCQYWSTPALTANKCLPKKANGATCSVTTSECTTGYCIDGVCCDKACNGTCEACTTALTGQTTGSCAPIPNGQGTECRADAASTCGQTGLCNGASGCQLHASGTQCADVGTCATETSRNIPDTCNGTGSCVDKLTANCTAGYACVSGVCQTQCTLDTQCASAYYCDIPSKTCVLDKKPGQACLRDGACEGNANCVEIDALSKLGVCCNSNCAGDCQSCLNVNTGAADGTCSNVNDDLDPKNKCVTGAAYPNSCAAPGTCNGQGACRAYAKVGVECDTDVCTDSTLTTYGCNGAGTCKAQATQCYPFKCDTLNNVCRGACSLDSHCVLGSSCENGTCVGQLTNGEACTRGPQCKTGFCANIKEGVLQGDIVTGAGGEGAGGAAGVDSGADSPGVCCDTECQGTCSGCKASVKGFGSDGVCEFVKNNIDPANDCEKADGDACGLDGQCNGAGACRLAPSGSSCGATSCQGNSVLGQSCNGQGDCINNQGGVDCAPYVCRDVEGAFQCTNPCAEDNDCQDGYYCSDAKCSKKLANGKACEASGICDSGFCVDGLCCDTSCNGQCEACDSPGNEGICSPVQGAPHGTRPACDHAGEECGGSCDGVNASSCKYAANGTSCGEATCDNGLAKSSICNGQGECRANKNSECSPYVCGTDDACLERCEQDADCSQGYACDETTQRCLPSAVAAVCSEDRLTSVGQNGSTPCKPFLCVPASGTCAVSCAFTTDCAPDFVCEASTKTCLPAPPESNIEEESCACRAPGAAPTRSSSYLALAALGLALTGLRRRRRSRKPTLASAKPGGFASDSHPSE